MCLPGRKVVLEFVQKGAWKMDCKQFVLDGELIMFIDSENEAEADFIRRFRNIKTETKISILRDNPGGPERLCIYKKL